MIQKKTKTKKSKLDGLNFSLFFKVLLSLCFVVFLVVSNWRIYQKRVELGTQMKDLEKKAQDLEKENQDLQEGFSQLSDSQYLEKIAREKLGLKKPGEEVVIVIPPPENEGKTEERPKTFWQNLLEKIGL